ncbi:MAG: hypothetical protein JWL77_4004 [Chthonomonadaceae bacterium]|nr:hypothetical protein [Chthonomonadaceae bacterium]
MLKTLEEIQNRIRAMAQFPLAFGGGDGNDPEQVNGILFKGWG